MQQYNNQIPDCLEVNVGAGVTLAQYIGCTNGEGNIIVKYISGGTLYMMNPSIPGSTMPGSSLVAQFNSLQRYLFGTTEVVSMGGPATFYLASVGATTTVGIIRGITPQTGL